MHPNEQYARSYLHDLNFDLPVACCVGEGGRYPDDLISVDPGLPVEEDGIRWRRYRHRTVPGLVALLHPDESLVRVKCLADGIEQTKDFRYVQFRDLKAFDEYVRGLF